MYNSGKNVWAKEFRERRAEVPIETIEKYLHNLYRLRPDFVRARARRQSKSDAWYPLLKVVLASLTKMLSPSTTPVTGRAALQTHGICPLV